MNIALLILAFIISIILHELGHLIVCKIYNIKVETLSIFFGRPIFVFNYKDTRYCIGWIPWGGFIDVDWGYQKKWQKLLMLSAGVLMNFAVAISIIFYYDISFCEMLFFNRNIESTSQFFLAVGFMNLINCTNILPINGLDGYIIYNNILK